MPDIKLNYSVQAENLIKNLKAFDRAEFEKWFFANLPIGSRNVLEYLLWKEQLSNKIIKPIKKII